MAGVTCWVEKQPAMRAATAVARTTANVAMTTGVTSVQLGHYPLSQVNIYVGNWV